MRKFKRVMVPALVFASAVVPIDRCREMVGVRARVDQLPDGGMPLSLAVGNSSFKIGNGQKHIPRLAAHRLTAKFGQAH